MENNFQDVVAYTTDVRMGWTFALEREERMSQSLSNQFYCISQ